MGPNFLLFFFNDSRDGDGFVALFKLDHTDALGGTADWTWNASSEELPLPVATDLASLLGTSGVVQSSTTEALVVGRDADAWWLELRGANVQVLWSTIPTPAARIASNGSISCWKRDMLPPPMARRGE